MSSSGLNASPVIERRTTWWREPLVHFVVLGGLVFLAQSVLLGAPPSEYVTVEDAPVEQIRRDWLAAKGSLPSDGEEAALIREWVEEEVLYRRAIELGLDQNDTIIRRRLVQRMRFFLDDTHRIDPPTDAELRAWFEQHPDRFAIPAETGFRHRFFSRGRHGAELEVVARSALEVLRHDSNASVDDDPFFRGSELDGMTPADIKRAFGADFEEGIAGLPIGKWMGPVKSSYGLHLVYVRARKPGKKPSFEAARGEVARAWLLSERERRNAEALAELRARYAPRGTP